MGTYMCIQDHTTQENLYLEYTDDPHWRQWRLYTFQIQAQQMAYRAVDPHPVTVYGRSTSPGAVAAKSIVAPSGAIQCTSSEYGTETFGNDYDLQSRRYALQQNVPSIATTSPRVSHPQNAFSNIE